MKVGTPSRTMGITEGKNRRALPPRRAARSIAAALVHLPMTTLLSRFAGWYERRYALYT